MKKSAIYFGLILLITSCNSRKTALIVDEVKSFKTNVKYFTPDKFELEKIPYPKIDSLLFLSHFSSIPELTEYSDHTSSVYVYSKNKFSNGIIGITFMAQDDMFTKKYIMVLLNKDYKIVDAYLIAYSNMDEEWYEVTETRITNENLFKTNKVSCEILSHVDTINYCKCDSSNILLKLEPKGALVNFKEDKYQYTRVNK